MTKALLIAALLGLAAPSPSIPAPAEKWSFPLEPLKAVPAEVRSQTPRGAKTLQCGLGPANGKEERVLLHLYSLPNLALQHRLDLYKRKGNRWRRVNRIAVTQTVSDYDAAPYPSPRVGTFSFNEVGMTWLNRKQRSTLLVPLYVPGYPYEQVWLIVFAENYAKPPAGAEVRLHLRRVAVTVL